MSIAGDIPSPSDHAESAEEVQRIERAFAELPEDYQEAMSSLDFYATVPYDRIRGDTTGRVKPILNFPRGIGIRDEIATPPTVRYFNVLYDQ